MPRITNIEVARKNLPLRIILLVLALVIAFAAFGYGLTALLTTEPGWKVIESNSVNLNCSADFSLNYNLGAGEQDATAEDKALTVLYSKVTEDAYQLFNNDYASAELHNIRYVNEHINQEITVEPALYEALSAVAKAGNRNIYLAPAYATYWQLFLAESEVEALQNDPQSQPEIKDYFAEIAAFANDPEMIDIELLGEGKLRVNVAQAYLDFIESNEITYLLDFSWMTNAFIADYIADVLIDNGFTNGYLSSFDGFTRNLYPTDEKFALNVYDLAGRDVLLPATLEYTGGCSLVALRDFPLADSDRWHYYAFEDGHITNLLVDPATGLQKSAVNTMISYSRTAGCADILLSIAPLYIADTLDTRQVNALTEQGIYTVYTHAQAVCTNDPYASLRMNSELNYTKTTIQ